MYALLLTARRCVLGRCRVQMNIFLPLWLLWLLGINKAFLDISCKIKECFFDSNIWLCTGFFKVYSKFLRKCLSFLCRDNLYNRKDEYVVNGPNGCQILYTCEHTFLSVISHLLPMRILLTPSLACCSMLENHVLTSERGRLDSYLLFNM